MKDIYKKKKLLIFGNYGVENVGDEAILAGLISAINKKRWEVTVVSANPLKTKTLFKVNAIFPPFFGFKSFFKFTFTETLKTIISSDLIIFGGGGLFQDKEKRAFLMWAYFLKICQILKRKVILASNTVGPIKNSFYKKRAKILFKKIGFFSLRDEYSLNILKNLNVPKSKIYLSTDAVFFLKKPRKKPKPKKEILFILHGKHTSNSNINKIKYFVQELKNKNEKLLFIPMQINIIHDEEIAKKLEIECFKYQNFKEVFNKIAESKLVITSRLHGAIFSIISKTPFLAFSPMAKVKNFMESAGISDFYLKSFDEKTLLNFYKKLPKDRAKIVDKLNKTRMQEKEKTKYILPDFI